MPTSRTRLLVVSPLAVASVVLCSAVAPALAVRAPKKITPSGVGAVKLGKTYAQLRAAHLIGSIGPDCEFFPNPRSARLRPPLKGPVNFTTSTPPKVTTIAVTGGATARGVGIGASTAKVKQVFPKAIIDHRREATFGVTLLKIPKTGGGRLQFAVDKKTKKVTLIGIPKIAFCE